MERHYRIPLLAAVLAHVALQLQWAHSIAWDEVEFFRATRWVAEGRVPFRDFWEHHTPLQWLLFAPVAAFADSPGVAALLTMRWAQVALWIALFAILHQMMRDGGIERDAAALAPLVLLASPLFVFSAIEYRIEVPGELAYLAALLLVMRRPRSAVAWSTFGVLMSAAVLANLRMVYLVVPTAAIMASADLAEGRWRWNPRALWMLAGVAVSAAAFTSWLAVTDALDPFLETMRLNVAIDAILAREAKTLVPLLLTPFRMYDVPAIGLFAAGLAAAFFALREIRRPRFPQLCALLALLSLASVFTLGVHYPYHLQTTMILFTPLAGTLLRTPRVRTFVVVAVAALMAVQFALLTRAETGVAMRYQDTVMREADRRTRPDEKVWDGAGFALHRDPAYRYWFLPSVVRLGTSRGMLPSYAAPELLADPPAAIVHTERIHYWLLQEPSAAAYVTRHYVPLYRDLWIPGLSAIVPSSRGVRWIVPRSGRYRLVASDVLTKHPWFTNPVHYPLLRKMEDIDFDVELALLPRADRARLRLVVDGNEVTAEVFELNKGSQVSIESLLSQDVGVLIVPDDVTTLFISPDAQVMM